MRLKLIALLSVLALAAASPAAGVAGFGDVEESDFFAVPVQWMANRGITSGVSATCFAPDAPTTRAQGVTFLYRVEREPSAPAPTFSDIDQAWAADAIGWAEATGVTTGVSSDSFGGDQPLTRAQLVTMLWRLAGEPSAKQSNPFRDVTDAWAIESTAWAAEEGITVGVGNRRFAPDRVVTRGEAATFIYRYVDPRKAPRLSSDSPACDGNRGGGSSSGGDDPNGDGSGDNGGNTGAPGDWRDHVDAPRGTLGPATSTAVDPETVGISFQGGAYSVPGGFTWDETRDGGYLDFDRGRVIIEGNNVSISGALFDNIEADSNSFVVAAGAGVGAFELRHFRVIGGTGTGAVGGTIGRGNGSTISNFEIIDFDGDGVKPPIGSTVTDGFISISQRPGSAKHYDGIQITGRSNITLLRLRFRMEGNDNINSAIYVQHNPNNSDRSNNTTIRDIEIEHAPYVWFPVRLVAGSVDASEIVGRGPLSSDRKRPAALVLHSGQGGIDWNSVWTDFNGQVDQSRRD